MAKKTNLPKVISEQTGMETFLSEKLIAQIETLFQFGLPESAIANTVGIRPALLKEWLLKGHLAKSGLHHELYKRCAVAYGRGEFEFFSSLRKHALGSPAKYLMQPVKNANGEVQMLDGKPIMEPARDNEGKAILEQKEITSNPTWASWILEKRYKGNYSKDESNHQTAMIDDVNNNDAGLNEQGVENSVGNVEKQTVDDEEAIKVLETTLRSLRLKSYDE